MISSGLAGMQTAFLASWGKGKPIIGLLGEYDALPEMSQRVTIQKKPIKEGLPGHGCGHNLLGTGMAGAAVTIKNLLKDYNLPGTIRFYGCPAEEIMYGKIKMDEEHLFDDNDICLSWHPMSINTVSNYQYSAMTSVKFNFSGKSAHAAESPEHGRSALDAVELMNVGANYLREHVISQARIHYVITNGGGKPNVVPSSAQSWYFVRAPFKKQVDLILNRIIKISQGAALMTETEVYHEIVSGCYETVLNDSLNNVLNNSMINISPPEWTEDEKKFAKQLQRTIDSDAIKNTLKYFDANNLQGKILHNEVIPLKKDAVLLAPSTDISNVSKTVPTAQVFTCCMPIGTPGHTWQVTASVGSSIGHKGMLYAAQVIADATMNLITNPQLIMDAQKEFEHRKFKN